MVNLIKKIIHYNINHVFTIGDWAQSPIPNPQKDSFDSIKTF